MVKLSELLKREKAFGKTNRAEIKWAPRKVVTALSNGKINGLPGGSTIYISKDTFSGDVSFYVQTKLFNARELRNISTNITIRYAWPFDACCGSTIQTYHCCQTDVIISTSFHC